jgi:pseudouridylate synthase
MFEKYLDIHPEVQDALDSGKAVVALESTIISHGMPFPQNRDTAVRCQEIIREKGAVPATIGILKGRPTIGLDRAQIEVMATDDSVIKVSRRDLPFVVSQERNGATTVASSMILAHMAGIQIFVTGGIGGAHRGAHKTFDVSADLMELAQTDVAVVCSGCKSIIDIGLTLEYLETHGVPIVGYMTDEFPAFYTRKSGFKVDFRVETPEELARAIQAKWDLKLQGGLVISNPIPEEFAMSQDLINESIDEAVEKADQLDIRGKELTPFLLSEIESYTRGESLKSNQELVYSNTYLAAELAVSLAKIRA